MTTEKPPLSAEEIERLRPRSTMPCFQLVEVRADTLTALCDMAARIDKAERDLAHVEAERNAYLISLAEMNA